MSQKNYTAMENKFKFFAADYPDTPGVYLMKNGRGRIIICGQGQEPAQAVVVLFSQ